MFLLSSRIIIKDNIKRKEDQNMNAYYNNNDLRQDNINTLYQPAAVQKAKKKSGGRIVAMALCFSLLGGAVGTGGTYFALKGSDNSASAVVTDSSSQSESHNAVFNTAQAPAVTQTNSSRTKMTAAEVYKANVNSTVGITTSINTNYFGYKTTAAASGSGFIISDDGYIVTNHHVIDSANKITVTLYEGKTYEAELIGSDENNDIAVLKIDAQGLTPVKLGSSSSLSVGDDVAAIGNPLGELTFSLTTGVVSALERTITTQNSTMQLIQTDAAINSGNSGGALFNMYGEVVGVTNAKYSSAGSSTQASIDNIGFAIPIDNVKTIIQSLIDKGFVVTPYIGVGAADVSSQMKEENKPEGAVIKKVDEDSPAQQAGLKVDDIITEVNGRKIKSSGELVSAVRAASKGDKLVFKVYRDESYTQLSVTVDEKTPEKSDKDSSAQQGSRRQSGGSDDQYGNYDFFGDFGDLPF